MAPSERDVVLAAELHVAERHPALAGGTDPADLQAMAQLAEPDVEVS